MSGGPGLSRRALAGLWALPMAASAAPPPPAATRAGLHATLERDRMKLTRL